MTKEIYELGTYTPKINLKYNNLDENIELKILINLLFSDHDIEDKNYVLVKYKNDINYKNYMTGDKTITVKNYFDICELFRNVDKILLYRLNIQIIHNSIYKKIDNTELIKSLNDAIVKLLITSSIVEITINETEHSYYFDILYESDFYNDDKKIYLKLK